MRGTGRGRAAHRAVTTGLVLLLLGAVSGGLWAVRRGTTASSGCTVTSTARGPSYRLTSEQMQNAATVAAVAVRRALPHHAVTVALAAAWQESKLRSLDYGDRDSLGLFQQRPSQGWGTPAQVLDPVYAAGAFYSRLVALPDWQQLSVTDAVQAVQHSAAGQAYAQWEPEARATARALTGEVPAAVSCRARVVPAPAGTLASAAARELGGASLSGPQSTGHGWMLATWLVAHAPRVGVDRVTFDGRTWTPGRGGWAATGAADGVLRLHSAGR